MIFCNEELEMIATIRKINNDDTLDAYECLEVYIEIWGEMIHN